MLGVLSYWSLEPHGHHIAAAIAVSVMAATLWISKALPLAVTALLIPVGFAATGVLEESQSFTSFGHPVLFLDLGGYAVGAAVAANGLDLWVAQGVPRHAGQRSFNVQPRRC